MSTLPLKVPRAYADLYRPSRIKGYFGGRGAGKSHNIAQALLVKGLQKPMRWLCAREVQKSIRYSVKQLLDDKILDLGLTGFYDVSTERSIRSSNNGTEFFFYGLKTNPENIKSIENLSGAWVEEAEKISQYSLDLLLPTVRAPGSEIWFSWNTDLPTDPVDHLLRGGEPPYDSIVRKVLYSDNPFRSREFEQDRLWQKERDRDKYSWVYEGEYRRNSSSQVFKGWKIDELDVPETEQAYYGADWGLNDPTVLIKVYKLDKTLYIADERYKRNMSIDEIPAFFAGDGSKWENRWGHTGMPGIRRNRIIGDSASPQTIRYLKDRGFNIIPAKRGPGSIEEGIDFLLAHDIIVHPSCTYTIEELRYYSYKVDPHTGSVTSQLQDTDNHTLDALRYALENVRRRGAVGRRGLSGPQIYDL